MLGVLFLVVGLIEAVKKVLAPPAGARGSIDIPGLIGALIKAGLLYIAVGVTLLVLGLELIGQDVLPNDENAAPSAVFELTAP